MILNSERKRPAANLRCYVLFIITAILLFSLPTVCRAALSPIERECKQQVLIQNTAPSETNPEQYTTGYVLKHFESDPIFQGEYALCLSSKGADAAAITVYRRLARYYGSDAASIIAKIRKNNVDALGDGDSIIIDSASSDFEQYARTALALGRKQEAIRAITIAYELDRAVGRVSDYLKGEVMAMAPTFAEQHGLSEPSEAVEESRDYWDGLSVDEQDVVKQHGGTRDNNSNAAPCSVTKSDNAYAGHIEIWYYDCVAGYGSIGKESYTFIDGKLTDHTKTF